MKAINIILYILLIFLCACIKDVDEDVIPADQKRQIIVRCLISPQDTILRASVLQSIPFFNKNGYKYNESNVKNAKVVLSDGISSVQLEYKEYAKLSNKEPEYVCPSSRFHIYAGKQYYLSVDVPGVGHVDASTRIPDGISGVNLVKTDLQETKFGMEYRYELKQTSEDYQYGYSGSAVEYLNLGYDWSGNIVSYDSSIFKFSFYFFDSVRPNGSSDRNSENTNLGLIYRRVTSITIYCFNKSISNYPPLNKKGEKANDPLDLIRPPDNEWYEPMFTEPFYNKTNINGGLGFFEGYLSKEIYNRWQ